MPYAPKPLRPHWVPKKEPYRQYQGNDNFYAKWKWKKTAKAHKEKFPLCEACKEKGFTTAVEITDHIIRMQDGGDPYHFDNLQSLCRKCHNSKSGKEAHGIITVPKGKGKLKDK
jgi:5-methylcytosine-specific restriction enzyme A